MREDATGVRAGAGLTINGLVRWLVGQGLAGLEAWAGTPGTVGGALHGNAHFQGVNIGDLVREVRVLDRRGDVRTLPAAEMAFGYDSSRLQTSGEIAVSAVFTVGSGQPDALRAVARASLAYRKRTQPLDVPSAGCIFQNPDPAPRSRARRHPAGRPGRSSIAPASRARAKAARRCRRCTATSSSATGPATAREIRALVERCQQGVVERFGVRLREEIVYLGEFD